MQVYPSVEYDFVPSELEVEVGTWLHFQWTGSDANPNGNAGGACGTCLWRCEATAVPARTVPTWSSCRAEMRMCHCPWNSLTAQGGSTSIADRKLRQPWHEASLAV